MLEGPRHALGHAYAKAAHGGAWAAKGAQNPGLHRWADPCARSGVAPKVKLAVAARAIAEWHRCGPIAERAGDDVVATAASRSNSRSSSPEGTTVPSTRAFLQRYREEGWYLSRTCHYVKCRLDREEADPRRRPAALYEARSSSTASPTLASRQANDLRQFELAACVSRMRLQAFGDIPVRGARRVRRGDAGDRLSARRGRCSRCTIPARTRAGRFRRASSSARASPARSTTGASTCGRGRRSRRTRVRLKNSRFAWWMATSSWTWRAIPAPARIRRRPRAPGFPPATRSRGRRERSPLDLLLLRYRLRRSDPGEG